MMRFLLILAAGPLFAQTTCTYKVSPPDGTKINIGSGSSSGIVSVTVTSMPTGRELDCTSNWGTDSPSWIHFTGPSNQQGAGSLTFSWLADVNPVPQQRNATIYVTGIGGFYSRFSVVQAATVCNFSLSPATTTLAVGGGSGTVQVNTNCQWHVSAASSWVTVPSQTLGWATGSGPVNYTADANGCVPQRTGIISVQSNDPTQPLLQFQITESGSTNNMSLSPASAAVPLGGTDARLIINTGDGCVWTAFSDVSWIQISSFGGSGNAAMSYHVPANTGATRTGNIHINAGGLSSNQYLFTITQPGAPPPPVQLTAVVNGASYAGGAVSPGEIVYLSGTNLGPATLAPLQLASDGHSITNSVGGTQVLFDGAPAPVIYASSTQVSAIVPYATAGKPTTQVQVQYQGTASNTVPVAIQAASPGIFTLDATGLGGGAILNQDYSVNSPARPASRGTEVIAIYCTGGGLTNPANSDGAITGSSTPLPLLVTQPVTVTIGGLNAQVVYAGGAPGEIAGLTQINAIVPAGVTPGRAAPVVVQIGTFQSQNGVTLAVQ